MKKPIVVGSVAYDPKIVTIWDIIRDYFITPPPNNLKNQQAYLTLGC